MTELRGNIRHRSNGHSMDMKSGYRRSKRQAIPSAGGTTVKSLDERQQLASIRRATLNRAKRSPIRHRAVGLQTPKLPKTSKKDILHDLKNKGIKAGKFIVHHAKTIHREPVKLAGTILLIIVIIPFALKIGSNKPPSTTDVESAQTLLEVDPVLPSTGTVKPESVQKDTERGIANYQDNYLGSPLTVTQQNLPPDFATSSTKLQEVASSIGASESFVTKNFGTVYFGTADGENAVGQRLVFATPTLLVFINAASKFTATQWTQYIESLTQY